MAGSDTSGSSSSANLGDATKKTLTVKSTASTMSEPIQSSQEKPSTLTKSTSTSHRHQHHHQQRTMNSCDRFGRCHVSRTVMLRFVLVASLLTAAGVCAALAYDSLRAAERATAEQTYYSVAASALYNAKAIAIRKFKGSEVTASLASWTNPNADDWPFIFINGYMNITDRVAQLTQSSTQAMMVFVEPSEAEAFEGHLQTVYAMEGRPNNTGYSDFGFGIWKPDPNMTYEDGRLHDTTGKTDWGGKHKILTVLSLHNVPNSSSLLYNVYSEMDRGIHVDSMFECAERHNDTATSPQCAVVTDMLELKIKPGPAGLLFQPVFPAYDPNKFVGFATTSIHWEEVLTNIVPDIVNGLTCVVSTATASYTYEIRSGGHVELLGDGDLHDPVYESYRKNVTLNEIVTGATTSAVYVLTVYPSATMFQTFSSNGPLAVALAFLGVIFLCTLLFFMYDFLMRHEAQQRKVILDMKRRFVRFISHEIRTPLNTVCVGLELLERELRMDTAKGKQQKNDADFKPTAEDVDFWHSVTVDVKENAGIAVSILNDLLNYDKLETKTLELEAEEVDIGGLIEQTVHQFQLQAIDREIDFNMTWGRPSTSGSISSVEDSLKSLEQDVESPLTGPGGNQLCVVGDDVRLSQVFRNVISNALKFTPENGTIRVTAIRILDGLPDVEPLISRGEVVDQGRRRGSLLIRIKDSGVGLSKEQLQMLFGEGVQFDANKLQHGGGSGLGLNIAKGIVELHHGTIHAESDGIGHGTTFAIELPLYEMSSKDDDYGEEEVSQTHAQTEAGSSSSEDTMVAKSRRILVVEDALSSRKMLIRLLERDGHSCIPASNGKDAVEAIEMDLGLDGSCRDPTSMSSHVYIDTILMDYEMPFMKGPDATSRIRELGYNGTIIGVTGNVLSEDVEHFRNSGADEVLAKPISMARLREYWDRHP